MHSCMTHAMNVYIEITFRLCTFIIFRSHLHLNKSLYYITNKHLMLGLLSYLPTFFLLALQVLITLYLFLWQWLYSLLVYVENVIITGKSLTFQPHYFLGLEIKYFFSSITIFHMKYAWDLLAKANMYEASKINTLIAGKVVIKLSDDHEWACGSSLMWFSPLTYVHKTIH